MNKSYSVELFPSVLNQSKFSLKLVSGSTNSTIQKDVFLKNDLKQKETADLCVFTELLRHCVNLAYNYAPQNDLGNKKNF